MTHQDRIFAERRTQVAPFEFDDRVADVFPDMIQRSVPGYASMLSMIRLCASRYVRPGTRIYDLGCSLGASVEIVRPVVPPDCRITAVDSSAAMVSRLQARVGDMPGTAPVEVREDDIRSVPIADASLVILNLTLQFVPPDERDAVIARIAEGTVPGGILVLSEKVVFDDPSVQERITDLHLDFKRSHNYSELEIAQKRASLENRLVPETIEQHLSRLRSAGFREAFVWFQCFSFVSILGVR